MRYDLYKYIVIIFSLIIFWLCIIPLLFSQIVPVICENLSYNSPYNIKVENPELRLNIIPVATVKAKKIVIKAKDDNDSLQIDDLKLVVRILPLLSGRIHIDKIYTENINIDVSIEKNNKSDKRVLSLVKKIKIICDSVDIKKIKTSIKHKDKDNSAECIASDIWYVNNGRYIKFNMKSELNIDNVNSKEDINIYLPKDNNVSKSIINIHISNLDIEPIVYYLKEYFSLDCDSAKGIIDLDVDKQHLSAVLKNIEYLNKDEAKSIVFPDKLSITSDLNLTRKAIIIDNAEVKSKNINMVFSGTVSDYLDKSIPSYDLNIRLNKSKIEDFISMLPVFKTEDIDSYKLKKYKFYGDIIGNFSIKGDNLEPAINGNIYINNGILTKPIPNTPGASIKLNFKGKYLDFDVFVPAGKGENVYVKGGVELYNVKYSDMRVWSTKHVDLATAESKVVPVHEILNFVIGPVPIMDIKGNGNIDIIIKGNRKNPHVWGILDFKNVTTNFLDMPDLVMTNADAILTFDDENAVFNLKKGFVNGKDINIDGTCNLAGKFDFDVQTKNQDLEYLYKSLRTSSIIDEVKNMTPQFDIVQGASDLRLKVYGNIKDINDLKFNKNFFVKGTLNLLGNTFKLQEVTTHNATGSVNFDNTDAQIKISSFIGHSPFNLGAVIKGNNIDADVSLPKLNLCDLVSKNDKLIQSLANIFVNVSAKYKGRTDIIEYDKVQFDAQILNVSPNNKLKLSNGKISLKNGKLLIKDINGIFDRTNSSFKLDLRVDDIPSKPVVNGNILLKDFELSLINLLHDCDILPSEVQKLLKLIQFKSGKINMNAKISNNNVNASTNIGGIEFVYTPVALPVKVINGSIYIRKNHLGLNKINFMADEMPILFDGGVSNIFTKPDFNIYINTKPTQAFIDKYINNNRIYPVKLKGDIVYLARIKGATDNFNIETEVNFAKDSSLYYLGAMVGDIENAIILSLDMNVINKKILKIKEFSYDKLIDSQGKRQTRLNMLKAYGGIDILDNDILYRDLKVKTGHPTDVKILNILFKKPNIKQGQFSSDVKINGKMSNPHITGTFKIVETDIPFFDTTMKTISFVFRDKNIEFSSKGEVLGNDIIFKGVLRNKFAIPYYIENAELYTKDIDLNYITNKLKAAQLNDLTPMDSFAAFDIKNTVIKNLKLKADRIKLRNITASDVEAILSVTDKKVFNVSKVKFNVAEGFIDGKFSYNLLNDSIFINLNAKNINANDIAVAMFDLSNHIYGSLTGNVKLSCIGSDFNKCMNTLNGSVDFDVIDGRMPKLGSLEYLLKAGNLVKGGFTGLSLNSVIDVLIPLKTGEFSEIYGKSSIQNGITNDIEISSRGKDLSLFMTGSYNFGSSNADMVVLGLLSKNISTMLGPIGNVSLNTLFNVVPGVDLSKNSKMLDKINKIPGLELNSKTFRKFIAEINGNINGDNYVKSFRWIN